MPWIKSLTRICGFLMVLLEFIVHSNVSAELACSEGYTKIGKFCYILDKRLKGDFETQRKACVENEDRLIEFPDEESLNRLHIYIKSQWPNTMPKFWIGLVAEDGDLSDSGQFKWVSNERLNEELVSGKKAWRTNFPKNISKNKCVLSNRQGLWENEDCSYNLTVMACQYYAEELVDNTFEDDTGTTMNPEKSTKANTQATTKKLTENSAQQPTKNSAEATSEIPTEIHTQSKSYEGSTEKPYKNPTEAPTENPTYSSTENLSDRHTEKSIETTNQASSDKDNEISTQSTKKSTAKSTQEPNGNSTETASANSTQNERKKLTEEDYEWVDCEDEE